MTNVVLAVLPNVGSNDHAYLRHVLAHWDSLAPLTLLCEAGAPERCHPDTVQRPMTVPPALPAFGSHVLPPRVVVPRTKLDELLRFSMRDVGDYSFKTMRARRYPLVRTGCADFGSWLRAVLGALLASWLERRMEWTVYGGYFAVERENLKRLPRPLFARLAALQTSPNAEVDHFIERTWGLLLTTPHVPRNLTASLPPLRGTC